VAFISGNSLRHGIVKVLPSLRSVGKEPEPVSNTVSFITEASTAPGGELEVSPFGHGLQVAGHLNDNTGPFASAGLWRSSLLKRVFDVVFSACTLILLAPAFLLIALVIKTTSPGPVLFMQQRYGLNRELFTIFKFRTMCCELSDSDVTYQALRLDSRVTRFGAFLRRTSLDELPQLLNVLLGNMSLVGPRPYAPKTIIEGQFIECLFDNFDERFSIRPGMTGLAQVNGQRGPVPSVAAAFDRFQIDVAYTRVRTIGLDVKIVIQTIIREFITGTGY